MMRDGTRNLNLNSSFLIHNSPPRAYQTGTTNFYGFEFKVNSSTLIPRPETEQLVEKVSNIIQENFTKSVRILDVGTGSGVIAITLKKLLPQSFVSAIDNSPVALEVAQGNAKILGTDINFSCGTLLVETNNVYDVIVANLPYVPSARWRFLPDKVRSYEPRNAIDGGRDGLKLIKKLIDQLPNHLTKNSLVALEIDDVKAERVQKLLQNALPTHRVWLEKDLASFDRFAFALTR